MSCVVVKHTMWKSNYFSLLFSNEFTNSVIHCCITELVSNSLCNNFGRNGRGPISLRAFRGLVPVSGTLASS